MNTWNTITPARTSRLDKAVFILDAICQEESIEVLNFLSLHANASFIDLLLHTRFEETLLDETLDKLCETRVVKRDMDNFQNVFFLDVERFLKIGAIATQLASFYDPNPQD